MNALRRLHACLLCAAVALAAPAASVAGTIVHFETNVGAFDVELFDAAMPITVANFLTYVNAGTYDSTIIHRSTTYNPTDIQVVQGGGYLLSGSQLFPVATNPPIVLESGSVGNVRGTIAMARDIDPDSATSQYYFNIQDNPVLDGNYAVFGAVVGTSGLAALDAIGALTVYNASSQLGSAFAELPLLADQLTPENLVLVTSVVAVPEPSTFLLATAGVAAAMVVRRGRTARGYRAATASRNRS